MGSVSVTVCVYTAKLSLGVIVLMDGPRPIAICSPGSTGMAADLTDRASERMLACRLFISPAETFTVHELDEAAETFH